jgi:ABC-type multidrug transport system permease subunit
LIWQALAIARKEFLHLAHDRLALALTLGLPAFQLILYGYALDTRIRNVPAAVLNRDSHQAGRMLARRISESPLFDVGRAYNSESQMASAMRAGVVRVAIEIPETYTADLLYGRRAVVRVWVDGSNVVSSNYILSALDTLGYEEVQRSGRLDLLPLRLVPSVSLDTKVLFNPEGQTTVFLIPALIAILIQMITTLLIAVSITTEREKGTLEQMRIARAGMNAILAGKCAAIASIGLLESGFLVALMRWLFGIGIRGSVVLLCALAPLLVVAPLGIGLLVAAKARKHAHALQLTHLVFLPSVMLSGFIVPREFLNAPIGWISNLLPATYLVEIARNVILRGASAAETAPAIAMTAALGVALTFLGCWAMDRSVA